MARKNIEDIRDNIRAGNYAMTVHAIEEMAEDGLDILDIPCASDIQSRLIRRLKNFRENEQAPGIFAVQKSSEQWWKRTPGTGPY